MRNNAQTTLPEIASHFAAALRDARIGGPLHIIGYSFDGMLAYEVARQFHDGGVEVGLVTVIDTGPEQLRAHARWPDVRNLLCDKRRHSSDEEGLARRSMLRLPPGRKKLGIVSPSGAFFIRTGHWLRAQSLY